MTLNTLEVVNQLQKRLRKEVHVHVHPTQSADCNNGEKICCTCMCFSYYHDDVIEQSGRD